MRLNFGDLGNYSPEPLAEDSPLPPEDRVVLGSLAALEGLYHEKGPKLRRFFGRRVDRQDTNDLVQESFARMASAVRRSSAVIENPEAYLQQIATNILRDRANSALQRSLSLHVPIDETEVAAPDPIAALEARDTLNRLQSALLRLKPKTREVFLAHRVDGQSYRDIADRQGLSMKGVEWHMRKAIAHLDRVLRSR
ncbi:RNA polymerase sigma factor [Sphingobium phenoxybenzoativorans]|uniref:RNA polymerase sigma factor n=1 Tax=Sphingobium phenoxybenzoativorans TaxID=1592790 RepID=UPI00087272D6|nr:RNA polymerase sigma factor [Sphingobium phenoxybenzoativorans]